MKIKLIKEKIKYFDDTYLLDISLLAPFIFLLPPIMKRVVRLDKTFYELHILEKGGFITLVYSLVVNSVFWITCAIILVILKKKEKKKR